MGDFFLRSRSGGNDKRRLIAEDDLDGAENGVVASQSPARGGYGAVPGIQGMESFSIFVSFMIYAW